MTIDRAANSIQSIQRAAALMRCFTEADPELGVTELSQRTGLHKSTVSRILSTLQREGFVGQNPATGRYRLGIGLISLAGVALGRVDVRSAAYYHLDALVESTQETVNLAILDGGECVIVDSRSSPKPLRYTSWIGRRLPLHCTANGKVLLAGLDEQRRRLLLVFPLRRYTPGTIVAETALAAELARVEARGYASAEGEFEEGYCAVAVPIVDSRGHTVASLSVSGPSLRMERATLAGYVDQLSQASARISTELSFAEPGR